MTEQQLGVIFDMDGVLVASGKAHAASWRLVARRSGIEVSDAQFKASFGQTSREIVRAWWGDGLSDAEIERIDDEKEAEYRELITGMVPLTVGVREVLAALQMAGMPLAVGTSGPAENVALVLNETGIGEYFNATVNGKEVANGKPAPDIFLLAAERIGVPSVNCVVIEDAPVGVQAAQAAGMRVIAYTGTHDAEAFDTLGPDRVIENIKQITPAFVADVFADA